MRVLSLIVGLLLGFIIAAGFYGGGGALTIAGKQIGPDILLQGDVHSEGSGRTVEPGVDSPPAVSQNTAPSTVGDKSIIQLRWPK